MKLTSGSLSPGLSCPPRNSSVSSGAGGFSSFSSSSLTPFRMNTRHPAKDADPERPSGAEGFLPLSFPSSSLSPFRMNTYKKCADNPRRINTCGAKDLKSLCFQHLRKIGGGGWLSIVSPSLLHPSENRAQRTLCFQPLAHSLHTLLRIATTHLLFFQWFAHSLLKHGGCTPIILYPEGFFRGAKPELLSSLRLPPPYVLSFLCGLCASVATVFFLFWPVAELTLVLNRSTLEMTP